MCGEFTGDRWIPHTEGQSWTRKMFPFDDVIMINSNVNIILTCLGNQPGIRPFYFLMYKGWRHSITYIVTSWLVIFSQHWVVNTPLVLIRFQYTRFLWVWRSHLLVKCVSLINTCIVYPIKDARCVVVLFRSAHDYDLNITRIKRWGLCVITSY